MRGRGRGVHLGAEETEGRKEARVSSLAVEREDLPGEMERGDAALASDESYFEIR